MSEQPTRGSLLDRALDNLLRQAPDVAAAAVVSVDGLPMASALPTGMDEDRVAAMCAALLSLGERAAEGLGRGELSQVYVEGEHGTVFLVAAEDQAVLVTVAVAGAKAGLMIYEARRAARAVATALRIDDPPAPPGPVALPAPVDTLAAEAPPAPPDPLDPSQLLTGAVADPLGEAVLAAAGPADPFTADPLTEAGDWSEPTGQPVGTDWDGFLAGQSPAGGGAEPTAWA